jgi:hypothetical protein
MVLRASVTLLCSVFLLAACAGPSGPKQSELTGYKVSNEAISVMVFSEDGAFIHYNAPHDHFGRTIAEEIASGLRTQGHTASVVSAGENPAGPIVVVGRIAKIEAGSRATRYLIGFGAGSAKFGVTGVVQNGQGEELATFADERWAGVGVFGGNPIDLVQKCLRKVGQDVALMMHTGQYRTAADN